MMLMHAYQSSRKNDFLGLPNVYYRSKIEDISRVIRADLNIQELYPLDLVIVLSSSSPTVELMVELFVSKGFWCNVNWFTSDILIEVMFHFDGLVFKFSLN